MLTPSASADRRAPASESTLKPMMSPLELLLFGYSTAYRNDASSRAYHAAAAGLAEKAGATPAEFEQAVGFLRGARLLPW